MALNARFEVNEKTETHCLGTEELCSLGIPDAEIVVGRS